MNHTSSVMIGSGAIRLGIRAAILAGGCGVAAILGAGCGVASAAPGERVAPTIQSADPASSVSRGKSVSRAKPRSTPVRKIAAPGASAPAPQPVSVKSPTPAKAVAQATRATRGSLLNNQSPTLRPTQTGQGPNGVVNGQLNPVDPDSAVLTYSVTQNPVHGAVAVAANGSYTYTPDASLAATGTTDSFGVSVSDAGSGFHFHGIAGLLNALSFGLLGRSGHTSTATVAVTVAPFGPPNPPPVAGQLTAADLSFEGFFRVPTGSLGPGQYATLAYGGAAMTSRVVSQQDGSTQRHFFFTGHRYANDPLVELVAPASLSGNANTAPVASLYRYWGDIYGGRKVTSEEPTGTQPNANWTEGLLWDEANQQMLWSYGNWYAADHVNNPVLGSSVLNADGSVTVNGPWRASSDSQQTRSFAVFLSRAVSAATGGATLGLGGKMQSINATASWGPSLNAISSPTGNPTDTPLTARVLISHPISPTSRRTPRAADYQVARNPDGTPDTAGTEPPVDGVGFWTELDETTGAVFAHTASGARTALIYTGSQASGLIWYGPDLEYGIADGRGYSGKGNHAQTYRPVLWLVSEADVVAAAQGRLSPDQVNPYATIDLMTQFPELGFLQGVTAGQPVFAEDEGRLYVPFEGGTIDNREPYPVIAVFAIAQ